MFTESSKFLPSYSSYLPYITDMSPGNTSIDGTGNQDTGADAAGIHSKMKLATSTTKDSLSAVLSETWNT